MNNESLSGKITTHFHHWMDIIFLILMCLIWGFMIQAHASFPGKNGKIFFQITPNSGPTEIYSMDADGGNVVQLTSIGDNRQPGCSADGTKVVFRSTRDGHQELYVMNADGSGQTRITRTSSSTSNAFPAWSTDGTKIAFASTRSGRQQLWVIDVSNNLANCINNDCPAQQLTNFPVNIASNPRYSPDGKKIVITQLHSSDFLASYVMNPDGSNVVQFTDASIAAGVPDWSPDASQINYSDNNCGSCLLGSNVFIADAPGPDFSTPITDAQARQITFGNNGNNQTARYSPNGQLLTFSSKCADYPTCSVIVPRTDVYTINVAGTPVATNISSGFVWDWQPQNYDFSGFLSPIVSPPAINNIKAGQAVPVKFSLNGFQGMDVLAAGYPQTQTVACDTGAPIGNSTQTTTAGSQGLQYDPDTDIYTYVWKTDRSLSGSCQQLIVKLAFAQHYSGFSGATYTANFVVK